VEALSDIIVGAGISSPQIFERLVRKQQLNPHNFQVNGSSGGALPFCTHHNAAVKSAPVMVNRAISLRRSLCNGAGSGTGYGLP